MRIRKVQMCAAVLTTLGLVAAANGQGTRKDAKPAKDVVVAKIQKYQLLLAKSKPTCTVGNGPPCIIDMKLINHDGRDYCVAVAPKLEVKTVSGGGGSKKIVAWKLSHSSLGSTPKPLAFHPEAGIILTQDADKQIEKGGLGDGGVGIPSPDMYHVKTKRDKQGAVSVYLPVVLWGPPGLEDLCAAIDPIIVNVP